MIDLDKIAKELGVNPSFGMLIRNYRGRTGKTQSEVAKLIGASKQYVSDLENERKTVSIKKAAEIAKALKMSQKAYVQMAINDQIKKANLKFRIEVVR